MLQMCNTFSYGMKYLKKLIQTWLERHKMAGWISTDTLVEAG